MQAKEDLFELCKDLWGVELTGRSDLHCYFWPAATAFLKDNGWFGFLVSSSWLDVEYGFALQEWVLTHFKIHAILESNAEPWFEDARVKTCAVILQRCDDPKKRFEHLVKFVRLDAPLADILGERPDENSRQTAAEKFRDIISRCKKDTARDQFRIVVVPQKKLWEDGLRAGKLFALQKQRDLAEGMPACQRMMRTTKTGKLMTKTATGFCTMEAALATARNTAAANGANIFARRICIFKSWSVTPAASCRWAKLRQFAVASKAAVMLFSCRAMFLKSFWTIIQKWNGMTRPCTRTANAAKLSLAK